MTEDIKCDQSTGDIYMEDIFEVEAFSQGLLLQLLHDKTSVLMDLSIGSYLNTIDKDTNDVENKLNRIISDAWTPYIESGEVKDFYVDFFDFDASRNILIFSIKVITKDNMFTISNIT